MSMHSVTNRLMERGKARAVAICWSISAREMFASSDWSEVFDTSRSSLIACYPTG
jgi:hypothetical protein